MIPRMRHPWWPLAVNRAVVELHRPASVVKGDHGWLRAHPCVDVPRASGSNLGNVVGASIVLPRLQSHGNAPQVAKVSGEPGALFTPGLSAPPGGRGENPRRVLPVVRVDEPARRIDVSLNHDSPGRRNRSVGGFIAFMGQQRNACASQAFRCPALHGDSRWCALPRTVPGNSHRGGVVRVPITGSPVPPAGPAAMASRYAVMPAFLRLMPALRMDMATACLMAFLRDAG